MKRRVPRATCHADHLDGVRIVCVVGFALQGERLVGVVRKKQGVVAPVFDARLTAAHRIFESLWGIGGRKLVPRPADLPPAIDLPEGLSPLFLRVST